MSVPMYAPIPLKFFESAPPEPLTASKTFLPFIASFGAKKGSVAYSNGSV